MLKICWKGEKLNFFCNCYPQIETESSFEIAAIGCFKNGSFN